MIGYEYETDQNFLRCQKSSSCSASTGSLSAEKWGGKGGDYGNQELARLVCMRKDARGMGRAKRDLRVVRERSFGVYGEEENEVRRKTLGKDMNTKVLGSFVVYYATWFPFCCFQMTISKELHHFITSDAF